jgi:hypothetical protein
VCSVMQVRRQVAGQVAVPVPAGLLLQRFGAMRASNQIPKQNGPQDALGGP